MDPIPTETHDEQDYWELVTGSKSLTTETVKAILQSIEGEAPNGKGGKDEEGKEKEGKKEEEKVKEEKETEGKEEETKEVEEKEEEEDDWYTSLPPATPANTPEYTPTPPSYPSATLRKDLASLESGELFPIKELKEEANEEVKSELNKISEISPGTADVNHFEYSPADSESEERSSDKTVKTVQFWLSRILVYVIMFSIVKWVWGRMKSVSTSENK